MVSAKKETRVDHDMHQKKLIFKIASNIKDSQNKANVDKIYERLLKMSDRETNRPGTDVPLVNNKDELISILEALERDNLMMYAAEENTAILM